jgi:hypothetical protein
MFPENGKKGGRIDSPALFRNLLASCRSDGAAASRQCIRNGFQICVPQKTPVFNPNNIIGE